MAWRFTVFDETFRESQLTLGQAARIEDLLGKSWADISPVRSANAALKLAAVMYADRAGIAVSDALTKLDGLTASAYFEEVDLNDSDDLPTAYENGHPPAADATPTDG